LGLAELESLYGAEHVSSVNAGVAGLDLAAVQIDFARLGGSTRLAEVVATVPGTNWNTIEKQLAKAAVNLSSQLPEGKLQLGLSAYGMPITPAKLNAAGLTLKKILRGRTGRSVRVTPNPELELNTAQVLHNHLTGPTGLELLVIATSDGQTVIARTVAVQDIESYTQRDRGRPKRDARVGMLPPKLAQVLINLAAGQVAINDKRLTINENIVLDPFCGTGVVLQEALLMGYNAYGTDLETRMIDYTGENLDWLDEQFSISPGLTCRFEQGDATTYQWDFSARAPGPSALLVASETYLGRPFTEKPSPEILAQTVSEVNLILKKFLRNLRVQLQPGARLCLAVPAWRAQSEGPRAKGPANSTLAPGPSALFRHLPLIDSLGDLGYNRISFEHVRDEDLIYYREDQIVARELLVLQRD
jgi:SAM-dependent methyltransferase